MYSICRECRGASFKPLPEEGIKRCSKCKIDKSISEFYKMKSTKMGVQPSCKECSRKTQKDGSEKRRLRLYKRRKTDVNYRLILNVKHRIQVAIKRNTKCKIKFLGIGIPEYKQYLESMFTPDMTWSNYGTVWNIDHIHPISKFDLSIEENIHKCFGYKNTQPMYVKENSAKGNKLTLS